MRPKLLVIAVAAALSSAPLSAEGLFEETVIADMDWQPMRVISLEEQIGRVDSAVVALQIYSPALTSASPLLKPI